MATNVPYKREGDDPDLAWNEVIRRINEMTEECGIEPLPEVDPDHVWTKTDIQEAQDKLKELCDEFEFDPPPDLWKQSTIDALVEAINEGSCCCEDHDVSFAGADIRHPDSGQNAVSNTTDGIVQVVDWAVGAAQAWIVSPQEGVTNWQVLYGSTVLASGAITGGILDINTDRLPYYLELRQADDATPAHSGLHFTVKSHDGETVYEWDGYDTEPFAAGPPAGNAGDTGPFAIYPGDDESFTLRLFCE